MTDNLPVPDDLPYLNLSAEEINQLRNKKHELTEYGKQKLKEMLTKPLQARVSTEDYNKVVNALNKHTPNYIPDDDTLEEMLHLKLTEEKKEELERLRRKEQEKDTDK